MKCKRCEATFNPGDAGELPRVLGYCDKCSRQDWAATLAARADLLFPCRLLDSGFQPPAWLASVNLGMNCPTYVEAVAGIGERGVSVGTTKSCVAAPSVAWQVPLPDIIEVSHRSRDKAALKRRVRQVSQLAASGAAALLFTISSCSSVGPRMPWQQTLAISGAAGVCFGLVVFAMNYSIRLRRLRRNPMVEINFRTQNNNLSLGIDPRWLKYVLKSLESFGIATTTNNSGQ
ncbi:MAG: hypothetical protein NTZ09_03050 [Candidatus Hydrogenedentes bacterium]|nr:hypothetical protein [Candidatus Hydrogenedentota bacterium]